MPTSDRIKINQKTTATGRINANSACNADTYNLNILLVVSINVYSEIAEYSMQEYLATHYSINDRFPNRHSKRLTRYSPLLNRSIHSHVYCHSEYEHIKTARVCC